MKSTQPGIECRELPCRTGSNDRDVGDVAAGIVRGGSRTAPGAWDMNEDSSRGYQRSAPRSMSSAILALPLSSPGNHCARSSPTWDDSGGGFQDPCCGPRNESGPRQAFARWRWHDVANPTRGTLTSTPCSRAARDRSAPSHSCRAWIALDSASRPASASPTRTSLPADEVAAVTTQVLGERGRAALQYGDYVGYSGRSTP